MRTRSTLLLCLLMSACALTHAQDKPPADKKALTPAELKPYEEFARKLEEAVQKNRPKEFAASMRADVLLARTVRAMPIHKDFYKPMEQGLGEGIAALSKSVCDVVAKDGFYKLLRVRVIDGEVRALCRLIDDGAINYHDFVLASDDKQAIYVADLLIAGAGESYSQMQGRIVRLGWTAIQKDDTKENVERWKQTGIRLEEIRKFMAMDKTREALQSWAQLPDSMRSQKFAYILKIRIASRLPEGDEKIYLDSIDEFRKYFPTDPAIDLLSFDAFFLRKKYVEAFAAIDRLDTRVGGDPYLDVIRAGLHLEMGEGDKVVPLFHKAIAAEPDMVQPWLGLLQLSLRMKNYSDTLAILKKMEKDFKIEFTDLDKIEMYAEFVKAPEYQEWLKRKK